MPATTPTQDADIYRLRTVEGLTFRAIAERYGFERTQTAVHAFQRYARANSLPDPVRRRSARQAERYARSAGIAFDPEQFAGLMDATAPREAGGALITNRTFGIEIEFQRNRHPYVDRATIVDALNAAGVNARDESYNHSARPHWKLINDGSTDLELVSPVLSGIDGLREVRAAMTVLRRFGRATSADGGHVHVFVGDLTPVQIAAIVRAYVERQAAFDALVPRSRRTFYGCRWARGLGMSEVARIEQYAQRGQVSAQRDRYSVVNLMAYSRQQTIEFRQQAGTLMGRKSNDWAELMLALVTTVEQGAHGAMPNDLHGMLDYMVAARTLKRATANRLEQRAAGYGFARPASVDVPEVVRVETPAPEATHEPARVCGDCGQLLDRLLPYDGHRNGCPGYAPAPPNTGESIVDGVRTFTVWTNCNCSACRLSVRHVAQVGDSVLRVVNTATGEMMELDGRTFAGMRINDDHPLESIGAQWVVHAWNDALPNATVNLPRVPRVNVRLGV
jgi:hypothetical protein